MTSLSLRVRKEVDYAALLRAGDESIYGSSAARFKTLLDSKLPDLNNVEGLITKINSSQFTLDWIRRQGLKQPVMISGRQGMGMKLPCPEFNVKDVARVVGPDWPIDVIDVAAQSEKHGWTLGQWASYYHAPADRRKEVYNVISLEFSGTALTQYVRSPRVVRQLDWIDTVWPGRRRAGGEFPAVQYYCLMSVAGSWTDFHVDFGGTSVWYHVHTGSKLFIFAPPTRDNLAAFEAWTTSSDQGSTFLTDMLGEGKGGAFAAHLQAGNTLLIPTGWIHAVYTPDDSLVFGGNFLHGLDMPGQLRIYEMELYTKVPRKYRFPYYEHIQWYAAAFYVQFTRLPQFRDLLSQAYALVETKEDSSGWSSSAAEGGSAAEAEALAARNASKAGETESLILALNAFGLSLHELIGLPALVKTLAHLRESLLQRRVHGNGASVSASAPAESGAPKLKLKFGPGKDSGASVSDSRPKVARAPRVKGAIVVSSRAQEGAGSSGVVASSKLVTAGAVALHGEDEYDVFPASSAATEASLLAGVSSGPEALLHELAAAIDMAGAGNLQEQSTVGGQAGSTASVLGIHAARGSGVGPTVARPLYTTTGWLKTMSVIHVPVPKSVEEAVVQAMAVGAASCFGLYGGAVPTFEGERPHETSGEQLVAQRTKEEAEAQPHESEESAESMQAGGSAESAVSSKGQKSGRRGPGQASGPPNKRHRARRDDDEDNSDNQGEDLEDDDYREGDGGATGEGDEEDSSDEDMDVVVEESDEEGGALGGEEDVSDDGDELVEVAGVLEEKAREEALLKQLDEAHERRVAARRANREASAMMGNVKVPIRRAGGVHAGNGKAGAIQVAVATSGSGQTRRLVSTATAAAAQARRAVTSTSQSLGMARALPGVPGTARPAVRAVGYTPDEQPGHGIAGGEGSDVLGLGLGLGLGLSQPAAHAQYDAGSAGQGPLVMAGVRASAPSGAGLSGAQRLQAALKAKGRR